MSVIQTVQKFLSNPVVERFYKTVIEVVAAQTALYTTVVPSPPNTKTSAALAGGAGVLSLIWNGLIALSNKRQGRQFLVLQAAIDAAVTASHNNPPAIGTAPTPSFPHANG